MLLKYELFLLHGQVTLHCFQLANNQIKSSLKL